MGFLDPEMVEQGNGVFHQVVEGIGTGRCVGQAVAAMVVAQDTVFVFQQCDLIVPQVQVVGERVAERDPRSPFRAFDLAIDLVISDTDFHGCYPFVTRFRFVFVSMQVPVGYRSGAIVRCR